MVNSKARPRISAALFILSAMMVLNFITLASDCALAKTPAVTNKELINKLQNEPEINGALAGMDDRQVRQLLIEQLKSQASQEAGNEFDRQSDDNYDAFIVKLGDRLRAALAGARDFPSSALIVWKNVTNGQGISRFLIQISWALAVLGFGFLIEWIFRKKYFRNTNANLQKIPESDIAKLKCNTLRSIYELLHLAIFFLAVSIPGLSFKQISGPGIYFPLAIIKSVVLIRFFIILAKFILSPDHSHLRIFKINDPDAIRIYNSIIGLTICWIAYGAFYRLFGFYGSSESSQLFHRIVAAMLLAIILIGLIYHNKKRISREEAAPVEQPSAISGKYTSIIHSISIVYIIIFWIMWEISILTGVGATNGTILVTLLVIPKFIVSERVGCRMLEMILQKKAIRYKFQISTDNPNPADPGEARPDKSRFLPIVQWIWRVSLTAFLLHLVVDTWDLEMPYKGQIFRSFFNISIALLVSTVLWEFIKSVIEKRLSRDKLPDGPHDSEEGDEIRQATRLRTLLPLFRKFIATALVALVLLIILSTLGIEIGPLLASVGIFGLALGLGAQTLVKDIMSGIFFLIDDAFRVGEWITLGKAEGAVVKISLRTLTLRHYKGQMEVIPFGDISNVTNWSRGPMLIKFSLSLPADTNPNKVRKIIKKINDEMQNENEYGPYMVEPLKSQGVNKVEDGVMSIKVHCCPKLDRN